MVKRKEILKRLDEDKSKVINDNSDIFSSCKCGSSFHKFFRYVNTTLKTRLTQKKFPLKPSFENETQTIQLQQPEVACIILPAVLSRDGASLTHQRTSNVQFRTSMYGNRSLMSHRLTSTYDVTPNV